MAVPSPQDKWQPLLASDKYINTYIYVNITLYMHNTNNSLLFVKPSLLQVDFLSHFLSWCDKKLVFLASNVYNSIFN
jgi:hypothetical protein